MSTLAIAPARAAVYRLLHERFAPLFAAIARDAAHRDDIRELPFDEIAALKVAGFGTLLVPEDDGGLGGSIEDLTRLLIDLAAADPNIAQAFRGHFHAVHGVVRSPDSEYRRRLLAAVTAGDLIANGVTDTPGTPLGGSSVTLRRSADGTARLSGRKEYSTGNLYADWILVIVAKGDASPEVVIVPADAAGVSREDTWNGFGQKLTATGATNFHDVLIEAWQIAPVASDARGGDLLQLVLLAVTAGIARRTGDDLAGEVRRRRRVYAHGAADTVQADPQILQIVGEVAAAAAAVEAIVVDVARRHDALFADDPDGEPHDDRAVTAATYQAQTVVPRLVTDAAGRAFDALGASALDRTLALDRHWRNARTIASHNPIVYRSRLVGDWLVNGELDSRWSVGAVPPPKGTTP
ncbi:acyl-CoA dehydrogenase family protein [Microbacterium sp. NPDC055357]